MYNLDEDVGLFKVVFDKAPIGIALISFEGIWLEINLHFADILGYKTQELKGQHFSKFTHADDLLKDRMKMEELKKGVIDRVGLIKRYIHKDGHIVWVNFDANLIQNKTGETRYILGFYQDMTETKYVQKELQKFQHEFQLIVEKSPLPIIISTANKIEYINPQLTKLLGYKLEDISTPEKWFQQAYPNEFYRKKVLSIWERYIKNKDFQKTEPIEFKVTTKNGDLRNIEMIMMVLEHGKYMYILNDVTEKIKAEEQKIRSQKLESLGTLAGGIAHDFNNILVGILGNLSLMKNAKKDLDEGFLELIEDLEYSVQNATNLTNQLLTFAKGGRPVKNFENIENIIRSSMKLVMSGSKSTCKLSIIGDVPKIFVDAGQIQQVFNNLLINASQAMKNGGLIEILISRVSSPRNFYILKNNDLGDLTEIEDTDYIKIDFKDNGSGIPEEIKDKIFTPYFSTKQSTGLGLATAYSIVRKHHGFINFESQKNVGTTFSIYLPIKIKKSKKADTSKSQRKQTPSKDNNILVLEDEVVVQRILKAMLLRLNQNPIVFTKGEKLIEKYKKMLKSNAPADLVILDLTIPGGMGGKKVIKQLIKINPHVKAIVSSGYSTDPILSNPEEHGFQGVLKKPYTIEELKSILYSVL